MQGRGGAEHASDRRGEGAESPASTTRGERERSEEAAGEPKQALYSSLTTTHHMPFKSPSLPDIKNVSKLLEGICGNEDGGCGNKRAF